MAATRKYLDYLFEHVEISPALCQEELDQAELLSNLMEEHGLESELESFAVSAWGPVLREGLYVVAFLGLILCGFASLVPRLLGFALVVAAFVLLRFEHKGKAIVSALGPKAQSQNVVGIHRASGPNVVKGARKIVIFAHYDSPNEGLLYKPQLIRWQGLLLSLRRYFELAFVCFAVLNLLPFIPAALRAVCWLLSLLSTLPLLLLFAAAAYDRFANASFGANDNKSSVAALLGLVDAVRPYHDSAQQEMENHPHVARKPLDLGHDVQASSEANLIPFNEEKLPEQEEPSTPTEEVVAEEPQTEIVAELHEELQVEETVAADSEPELAAVLPPAVEVVENALEGRIRRGADFVKSLQILPADCEIEYQKPEIELPKIETKPITEPVAAATQNVAATDEEVFLDRFETIAEEPVGKPIEEPEEEVFNPYEAEELQPRYADAEFSELGDEETDLLKAESMSDKIRGLFAKYFARKASPESEDAFKPELLEAVEEAEEPAAEVESEFVPEAEEAEVSEAAAETEEAELAQATQNLAATSALPHVEETPQGVFTTEPEPTTGELNKKDDSGLNILDAETTNQLRAEEQKEAPEPVEAANWGTAEFKPVVSNIGRRAALFDLPDPNQANTDPLASASSTARFRKLETNQRPEKPVAHPESQAAENHASGFVSAANNVKEKEKKKGGFSLFKRKKAEEESLSDWLGVEEDFDAKSGGAEIGSWDNFDTKDENSKGDSWKGGASERLGLRAGTEPEAEPEPELDFDAYQDAYNDPYQEVQDLELVSDEVTEEPADSSSEELQEQLREAILSMGDDDLIAHDIWFVGLGASTIDNAGVKAFLQAHRRDIRGAFVVNLHSIGAGQLSLTSGEGSWRFKRTDRRILRLLSNVAADLNIDIHPHSFNYGETDAHFSMLQNLRSISIIGLDDNGLPAFSHSLDDTEDKVEPSQIVKVVELVSEFIRRS